MKVGLSIAFAGVGFLLASLAATTEAVFVGGILLGVPLSAVGITHLLTPEHRR